MLRLHQLDYSATHIMSRQWWSGLSTFSHIGWRFFASKFTSCNLYRIRLDHLVTSTLFSGFQLVLK